MTRDSHSKITRESILQAALIRFADQGYAATSVQQIVDDASVSKPALYYYFADKAALFQALVDWAYDERYKTMTAAAARGSTIQGRLVEILTAMFALLHANRQLIRLVFSTTLAAPGELPPTLQYSEKRARNFQFIGELMEEAQNRGELSRHHASGELAFGFYGLLNAAMVSHLMMPECELDQRMAERIVDLFLNGAGAHSEKQKNEAS